VVSEARELSAEAGMVLANELIDALPFWLVTRSEQEWRERRVGVIDGQFEFCEAKVKGELKEALMCVPDELVGRFPDGYETEVRPSTAQMLREMKSILSEGSLLLFDYGFAREGESGRAGHHRSRRLDESCRGCDESGMEGA